MSIYAYQHCIGFLVRPLCGAGDLLLRLSAGMPLAEWLWCLEGPEPCREGLHLLVCGCHDVVGGVDVFDVGCS